MKRKEKHCQKNEAERQLIYGYRFFLRNVEVAPQIGVLCVALAVFFRGEGK